MAPQESVLSRRVGIVDEVRVRMMMSMMRGPPQWPALYGEGA
jgi:hypothetical protein